MKILWANLHCLVDASSGASESIRTILKALSEQGWTVKILGATCFDTPEGRAPLEAAGYDLEAYTEGDWIKVIDSSLEHNLLVTSTSSRKNVKSIEEQAHFRRLLYELEAFSPDVVFSYGSQLYDMLAFYEARYRGITTATYLVNGTYRSNRWCLDCDLVLTDTETTAQYYRDQLALNPVPIGKFISQSKRPSANAYGTDVLFVNPAPAKGGLLVAQLSDWLAHNRPEIRIRVIDSRGKWEETAASYSDKVVHRATFGKNVQVFPPSGDITSHYEASRITLVPSLWYESGARVIAESLIGGIPIVATDRGGNRELIEGAGVLVKLPDALYSTPYNALLPWDAISDIAKVILRFFDDEEYYQSMRSEAARVASEKFDLEKNGKYLSETLRDVCQPTHDFDNAYQERHKQNALPIGFGSRDPLLDTLIFGSAQ